MGTVPAPAADPAVGADAEGPAWTARVVLLGASNLSMGLPAVLAATRARLGRGRLAVFAAAGHGRAYGQWSRVLGRGLPSILEAGLWAAAGRVAAPRTVALVTDVGNDLVYGAPPAAVAAHVERCLERLAGMGAETVLVLLPTQALARLPRWRYHLLKACLYPGRRLPFDRFGTVLAELDARLREAAARWDLRTVEPRPAWYRFDAIHIRWGQRARAWGEIVAHWDAGPGAASRPPVPPRYRCWDLAPAYRTLLGVPVRRAQPSRRWADGTVLWLY